MSEQQGERTPGQKIVVAVLSFIVLGLVGVAVRTVINTTNVLPQPATPTTPTSTTSSVTATPAQPTVLLDLSGSGTKQTQQFSTSGNWTLQWSYDCSMLGSQGNFQVVTYNSDGSLDTNDTLVNQLGTSGSDTEYYYDAGTHYLTVNSECGWHVTAKG